MPEEPISLAPAASPEEWDQVCATSPGATAFHDYDFLHAIAPELSCRFVPFLVILRGQPVGVAPLLVKQVGPFTTINWVPFPYLGPLVPEPLIPATLSALREEAGLRRALNHQQSFCGLIAGCRAGGFAAAADRTLVLPLAGRSDAELLAGMHEGHRWQIRRAQRSPFEVCPARAGDFPLLDAWLDDMYASRGQRNSYPPGAVQRIFEALGDKPGTLFQSARLNGQTVAVQVTLTQSQRVFGWQIAVDPAHRAARPQILLIWRAFQWARDSGASEFDMVGAPNDGIAAFKRRFGARERRYTVLQRQAFAHRMAQSARARLGAG